jgi:hypothetical protein
VVLSTEFESSELPPPFDDLIPYLRLDARRAPEHLAPGLAFVGMDAYASPNDLALLKNKQGV